MTPTSTICYPSDTREINTAIDRDTKPSKKDMKTPEIKCILTVKCQKDKRNRLYRKSSLDKLDLAIRRLSLVICQRAKRKIVKQMTGPPQEAPLIASDSSHLKHAQSLTIHCTSIITSTTVTTHTYSRRARQRCFSKPLNRFGCHSTKNLILFS